MHFLLRFFLGMFCMALILEIFFQVLPVSTATKTDYYLTSNIITYPANTKFVLATGWNLANAQHHETNNLGFISTKDFTPNKNAVALIGDSFVEANMLPENERLAAQLESKVHRPVYALGGPGSSLLDYAERAKFAQERFGIHDFVFVLERGDIRQTLCGSGNIHGPCIDPKSFALSSAAEHKHVSLAKRLLRESAMAQYLFSQLKLSPESVVSKLFPIQAAPTKSIEGTAQKLDDAEKVSPEAVKHIVSAFLASLPQTNIGHVILVLDSDRKCMTAPTPVHDQFIAMLKDTKIEVIDTSPIFCDFFHKTGLSLIVSPSDGHWNKLSHGLASDAVATSLMKN
jgi:hypothetical protein